jgi:signal transduction histidine kinase
MVRSDARALGQILINLVSNAIKFTEIGAVRVAIDDTFDGSVRISVTDTGPGIGTADLSRIFNAFERGIERSTLHPEGTGLGLHICQKLAELVEAEIRVETLLSMGSTFAVVMSRETT